MKAGELDQMIWLSSISSFFQIRALVVLHIFFRVARGVYRDC